MWDHQTHARPSRGAPLVRTSPLGSLACSEPQAWGSSLLSVASIDLCGLQSPMCNLGAFHLLFRTAGMKCTNMRWLLSTLPFPLAETRPETSNKVQSLSDELQGAKLGVHFSFWGQA